MPTFRWLGAALIAAPLFAYAQNAPEPKPAHFQGQVVDASGHPVRAAIVETDDPPAAVLSNDSGFFRFAALPAGPITVRVRRMGFEGVQFQLRLPPDSTVSIAVQLRPAAQVLSPIEVDAKEVAAHPLLAETGFYERMRAGWGHMVLPDEIEKHRATAPTASWYLQDIVGIKVSHGLVAQGRSGRSGRVGGGGGAAILGKTAAGNDCPMNILMNGQPVKMQPGETFDMFFAVSELYAIETYAHATDIPAIYQQLLGNDFCGAVVVWTVSRMSLKP